MQTTDNARKRWDIILLEPAEIKLSVLRTIAIILLKTKIHYFENIEVFFHAHVCNRPTQVYKNIIYENSLGTHFILIVL